MVVFWKRQESWLRCTDEFQAIGFPVCRVLWSILFGCFGPVRLCWLLANIFSNIKCLKAKVVLGEPEFRQTLWQRPENMKETCEVFLENLGANCILSRWTRQLYFFTWTLSESQSHIFSSLFCMAWVKYIVWAGVEVDCMLSQNCTGYTFNYWIIFLSIVLLYYN